MNDERKMDQQPQSKIDKIAGTKNGQNKGAKHDTVRALLDNMRGEIARALPKHMDADRMLRIALTTLRTNPLLLQCTQQSLLAGIMEAAQLGLELDGVLGHAYLVPYKNKGTLEAQFQIGYRGMIVLATRGGEVKSVAAECVYERDSFDFSMGTAPFLRHKRALSDRGEAIAVWACATLADGGHMFRVLGRDDVAKARESSRAADSAKSPWNTHPDEMARKTAIRSTLKYAPLSPEILSSVVRDEYRENGIITTTAEDIAVPSPSEALPEDTSAVDDLPDSPPWKNDEVADRVAAAAAERR